MARPGTLGELKTSGWVSRPVKEEVRHNALVRIADGRQLVDGVIGYEETVLPQLENALIAGHDVIFLGERGQAKTRMIRSLTSLLDEWMPIVAGSEINDDPYAPISHHARVLVADEPRDFADAVTRVLVDDDLAARIAAAGRRTVEERFDWGPIGERFTQVLLGGGPGSLTSS